MAKAKRRRKKVARKRTTATRKYAKRVKRVKRRLRRAPAPVTSIVANLTKARHQLGAQRDALEEQIGMIDQALAAMGTAKPAARMARRRAGLRAPRGRRKGSLKEYLAKVLAAKREPMVVKDITAAVRRAGYKTRNKTLAKSVGIALTQMPEVAKVGRGTFKLR